MPESDEKSQVEQYRQLVLEYEQLDEKIDDLLTRNNGGTEDMSEADYAQYREWAGRRDWVYDQIKLLERDLFDDA